MDALITVFWVGVVLFGLLLVLSCTAKLLGY
ncbi:hypothetical protein [Yersinia phage vB_YenM_P8]